MLILVLLGMYFDATVVFVKTFLLLLRLALAILCIPSMSHEGAAGDSPETHPETRRESERIKDLELYERY